MKIEQQYIVYVKEYWQILYYTNGRYFLTSKGGFGQLDYMLEEITAKEALKILKDNEENLKS